MSGWCLPCAGVLQYRLCAHASLLSGSDPSGALNVGASAGSNPNLATAGRSRSPHFTFHALLCGCSRLDQLLKIARPRTHAAVWPAFTRSDDLRICTDSTTNFCRGLTFDTLALFLTVKVQNDPSQCVSQEAPRAGRRAPPLLCATPWLLSPICQCSFCFCVTHAVTSVAALFLFAGHAVVFTCSIMRPGSFSGLFYIEAMLCVLLDV